MAKQILLYKKGEIKELKNWRPISLQQALTKIFMKVVQNRVIKVLEQDKIMSGMQKGFLRNNDRLERVQSLSMIIGSPRRNKQNIFGIFYDIQNTFGGVPQELIFETLEQHDFPKVFIDVIKSFYQRDATVVVNGKIRKKVLHQEVGVKQGCPLPPLLFILALDPVLRALEARSKGYEVNPRVGEERRIKYWGSAFADDLVLVSGSQEDIKEMHRILTEYLTFSKMKVGIQKSSTFGSTRKGSKTLNTPSEIYSEDGMVPQMETDGMYNYLGVSITPNTGKSVKRKKCSDRIENIMDMLKKTADAGLSPWQLQHCIKTYYLPTLIYSINQLYHKVKELTAVDYTIRKIVERSLRFPNAVPSDFIHCHNKVGGLGIPELVVEKDISTISTWYQLLTSADEIVRTLAWREIEDYANEGNVIQKRGAEYNINSGNCQHFLN